MNNSSDINAFEKFSFSDRQLLYRGLLALVKVNSGYGFCNNEQGHAAYAVGRSGKCNYDAWGDSPEHNQLFKMMHALSMSLISSELDGTAEVSEYVFNWEDFCTIAYAAYEENKKKG